MVARGGVEKMKKIKHRLNANTSKTSAGSLLKGKHISTISPSKLTPSENLNLNEFFKINDSTIKKNVHKNKRNPSVEPTASWGFSHLPFSALPSTELDSDAELSNDTDRSGWIVPLDEFERSVLTGTISFKVPKMVVDKKRRSKRNKKEKDNRSFFVENVFESRTTRKVH